MTAPKIISRMSPIFAGTGILIDVSPNLEIACLRAHTCAAHESQSPKK